MSADIPNTDQRDAVASSSDTDSIMSLAQHASEMNLDGSSSPVQSTSSSNIAGLSESTSSGSDNNDDTIVKDSAEDSTEVKDDEENGYLCFDKTGKLCDENTSFDQFKRWPAYLILCDMGYTFFDFLLPVQPRKFC